MLLFIPPSVHFTTPSPSFYLSNIEHALIFHQIIYLLLFLLHFYFEYWEMIDNLYSNKD